MYTISSLSQKTVRQYECLTFPSYQKHLQQLESSTIAIGASLLQQPIGLAVATTQLEPDGTSSAKVLSLFVKERYRNLGIGTALLADLETKLLAKGCNEVELVYMSGKPLTVALEKLLAKSGWEQPKSRMLVCKSTTTKIATAPWIRQYKLASSYRILRWVDLAPECRRKVFQQQQQQEWYPEALNPFNNSSQLESLNSLCLLYHGDVVGWMITHRINPNTIRYTSLFVRKDLQRIGRAIPILAEAIRCQIDSEIVNGIWSVAVENEQMAQFVKRRLSPYLTSLTETKGSQKSLSFQSSQSTQLCFTK